MEDETQLNPLLEYLLDLDKPVEACAKAFMDLYDAAVACIGVEVEAKKPNSTINQQEVRQDFDDKIAKLMKLHDLTIFQFVNTPVLVDSITHLMDDITSMNTYDDCIQLLDKWRGRPVDVYYIPEEGEETLDVDKEPLMAFRNSCTDIPNMYTAEFKEYVDHVNEVVAQKIAQSKEKGIRAKKQAITEVTAEYQYYGIHRLFSCMVVPAGHIDVEPDTVKIDGKWYNKDEVEQVLGHWVPIK